MTRLWYYVQQFLIKSINFHLTMANIMKKLNRSKNMLTGFLFKVGLFLKAPMLVYGLCAVVVGLAAGSGAVLIRQIVTYLFEFQFGMNDIDLHMGIYSPLFNLNPWQIMTVPMAGGLLIGLIYHYIIPGGRAQGVADVMVGNIVLSGAKGQSDYTRSDDELIKANDSRISLKDSILQTPIHILSIACGIFIVIIKSNPILGLQWVA